MTERYVTITNNFEISLKDNITKRYPFSIICESIDEFESLLNEVTNVCAELNRNWEQTLRFGKYNQELVQRSIKYEDTIDELKHENNQLKQTIEEIKCMDKETDIEIEHINNIYKEFGFKGVIDYAKDQLSKYGTVREVEKGLWLLATGGWSDHEFWLDCLQNWNFIYARGHYQCSTSGGGYYYSEERYADIKVGLK